MALTIPIPVLIALPFSTVISSLLANICTVVANTIAIFIYKIWSMSISCPGFKVIANSSVIFVNKITGSRIDCFLILARLIGRISVLGI